MIIARMLRDLRFGVARRTLIDNHGGVSTDQIVSAVCMMANAAHEIALGEDDADSSRLTGTRPDTN